jgi:hypothetical protein
LVVSAVDRVALGIDREGDAEVEELALGELRPAPQLGHADPPEAVADRGERRLGATVAAEHLAIVAGGIVGHPPDRPLRLGLLHLASLAVRDRAYRNFGARSDDFPARAGSPPRQLALVSRRGTGLRHSR